MKGKLEGVKVKEKMIGGKKYEKIYERIEDWEKEKGEKVKII